MCASHNSSIEIEPSVFACFRVLARSKVGPSSIDQHTFVSCGMCRKCHTTDTKMMNTTRVGRAARNLFGSTRPDVRRQACNTTHCETRNVVARLRTHPPSCDVHLERNVHKCKRTPHANDVRREGIYKIELHNSAHTATECAHSNHTGKIQIKPATDRMPLNRVVCNTAQHCNEPTYSEYTHCGECSARSNHEVTTYHHHRIGRP